ncbi:hypothetical protein B0181_08880 [Moraxella caviae]|uniref:Uncharacterized protein n=1 Tax=Moraxella caviae TaxID=34060 RepID=A0A1S9ZXC5_9GAMM|nr:hypothetical protein [Moraxella caviae]OOR88059.1 hypothetical protein B0181_08880 [Moraxella caviae]
MLFYKVNSQGNLQKGKQRISKGRKIADGRCFGWLLGFGFEKVREFGRLGKQKGGCKVFGGGWFKSYGLKMVIQRRRIGGVLPPCLA